MRENMEEFCSEMEEKKIKVQKVRKDKGY